MTDDRCETQGYSLQFIQLTRLSEKLSHMVLHVENMAGVEQQLCHLKPQIQAQAKQNGQTATALNRTNQSLLRHVLGDSPTVLANSESVTYLPS
jgi:hypothetical protein